MEYCTDILRYDKINDLRRMYLPKLIQLLPGSNASAKLQIFYVLLL